jgi:cobalt-zinc-cadmium efflux system outer membrane protein
MRLYTLIYSSVRNFYRPTIGLLLLILFAEPVFPQQSVTSALRNNQDFQATLQELIKAARNNPQLKAADAKAQASSAAANSRKSLDPPLVGVEFYQAPVTSFPNPFKDQMEYDYSIQQMLPFPGKLGAMAKAEHKRTEMLKADRQTLEQDIVQKVKSAYYELYLLYRRREINDETRELVRGFVAIARKQYETGLGKLPDVLRAQTELSSLVNDSIILVQQTKSMEGMLNALCNKVVTAEIGYIPEVEPVVPTYDLSALLVIADKNRPELKSMHAGVEMQQAERAAARKEYLPDFMVRGMYKQMVMSTDNWSVMLGLAVPIAPWSIGKYSSATARSDANIVTAQSERDNMKNMIAAEVNDALLKVESNGERLKLSKETSIPQAQQTLESALAAYITGKQEFLMLIDIQRMLVMAKLDYHMAVMTLFDSQSRLERAVGLEGEEIDKVIERGNQ